MSSIITDPWFYAAAIPAVLLLGLAKGGFSGIGIAATPLLALFLPPLEAAALLLPVLISQDMISLYVYRHHWDARSLKIMLPGALLGMGLAWWTAALVSDDVVRVIVGGVGFAFVLDVWLRPQLTPTKGALAPGLFWGGVSGFTSFMTQGGGPPYQVYMLPLQLPKLVLVGTTTIFFAILNVLKIGPYILLGQFNPANLATSIALLPLAAAANLLGIWLVRRMPTGLFYKIAYALLFVVSTVLMAQGIAGLLGVK
ncbi:sulfite exporter TauE/SafE family protein [Rhodopseudomonas palustris]|uniref:Probable membrane transporter protein n=1 Tax=Rhodopseudomonas palustris TaxID=1076 RepID=A0A418VM41_RHOPL|nr:sulfite exporter TauE/SafE family protein [Rhodopseudomonas palustris]RJF77189.1 sulfite exporter TauE/SafE family protein [Rhodopseudomonas palustris]